MSDGFDPYLRWLGIRDPQRPPNHYRLLGLEAFENDPDVIAEAADRQMGHIRTHQTGPHSEASQRILNELAKAKVCLLHTQRKQTYDQRLRAQLAGQGKPAANNYAPGTAPTILSSEHLKLNPAPPHSQPGPLNSDGRVTPPGQFDSRVTPPSQRAIEREAPTERNIESTYQAPPSAPGSSTGGMGRGSEDPAAMTPAPGTLGFGRRPNPALTESNLNPPRSRPEPLQIRLKVIAGPQQGSTFVYSERGTFTVGRSRQSSFSIPGDQALSRVHFSIKVNPPCCFIKNLSETHGTRVNGRPISETLLRDGDIIAGGKDTQIQVEVVRMSHAAAGGSNQPSVETAHSSPPGED